MAGTAQALGAPTLLTRIDPNQNMRRFYRLELSADLFGGVHLTREWGRIGRRGQSLTRWYESETEAQGFAELTLKAKRRRGYAEEFCAPAGRRENEA
ncbi:WGR domain-containing protein (plasmid) [Paracoccus sp. SCSIO 75233]|nr:WGR domain-containing protein [Paracoccus sp. SCSIO 75233]WBU55264.1 WGR domain-containing protein [Paracoccus sp. SCSIO 75233]